MKIIFAVAMLNLLLFAKRGLAQEFDAFDREKWREITRDINYSSGEGGEKNATSEESNGEQRGHPEEDQPSFNASGTIFPFSGTVFQVIITVLFIIALVFVISKLIGNNIRLRNNKPVDANEETIIDRLEEHLMDSDLLRWLKKAAGERNYRLALRIYYLLIIKQLSLNGLISWRKEKTNLEYLYEMRDQNGFAEFEEITAIYHLVWYGEKDLGDQYMIDASHKFKHYFQSINTSANG